MTARTPTVKKRANGIETQKIILDAAGRVFSRIAYPEARLKDIAEEGGISQGSLYFHFGNKDDLARAVLTVQQERMHAVLADSVNSAGSTYDQLRSLFRGLAKVIANDPLVQGGIRLSMQPVAELEPDSRSPYLEWVKIARDLIVKGIQDGSLHMSVDPDSAAETLNELFIGAQVLSGMEDGWKSLPGRVERQLSTLELLLVHRT